MATKFTLPPLPYAYDALEPYIDARTMEIHYTKHHQKYIDELNAALEKHPVWQEKTVEQLLSDLNALPEEIRTAVRNNGGGHYNHSLFWTLLTPNAPLKPKGQLAVAIDETFGSFEQFQKQFDEAAKKRFGSGWAWLSVDKRKLVLTSSANQDCPISDGMQPILGLDVWEHAYYLKYQNKRPEYIAAWWSIINWKHVEELYAQSMR
jgi:Fe-Mn family superoxide dismutase